jgi:hypothetical protein
MIASGLKANAANPRTITDEKLAALKAAMIAFGDLSGVVNNLTTGNQVGGHQRVKVLGDAPITILNRFEQPTRQGTVAEGYIEFEGERFVYREVQWSPDKEKAAMIAANKHGGDWDIPGLSTLLLELDEADFELPLTGFTERELEHLIPDIANDINGQTSTHDDIDLMRVIQLLFTSATLPVFMRKVKALSEFYGTGNVSDTISWAVELCYRSQCDTQAVTHTEQRVEDGRSVQLDVASLGDSP